MGKLDAAFVFIILAISIDGKRLDIGRTKAIAAKIAEEARTAASAVQNMDVTTPRGQVELLVIANEFTHRIQQAVFVINPAVPYIQNEDYKHHTMGMLVSVEELLYDVQRSIYEDPDKLQLKLVSSLEKYAVIIKKLLEAIVENSADESFIGDKIREASDIAIYAMYNIFLHATTLTKSNNELHQVSRLSNFVATFDKMKNNADETARHELTHLARFLTILIEEGILKLEYWINMNTQSTEGFKVVKEVARHLSESLDQTHRLVLSDKSTASIFEGFKAGYVSAARQIKKLEDIELRNVPGDQEYIRGLLIDYLTMCHSFATEIDIYLATKQPPGNGKRLEGGRLKSIVVKIEDEARAAANAVQNINTTLPSDKMEIFIIANQFIHGIQQALFVCNQALPQVQKSQYRHNLGEELVTVAEILYSLQGFMHGDADKLQQKIVSSLEKYIAFVQRVIDVVIKYHSDNEPFISEKIREASDVVIYTMYKTFFHATFPTKTKQAFEKESNARLGTLLASFDKLKNNADDATKDELTHLARFLTIIVEGAVLKLEYWMNMKTKSDEGFHVVKETTQLLSDCIAKLHSLVESDKSTIDILESFKNFYASATKQIQRLEDIQLRNTPGDQEYLRGLLIDNLSVSASFATEIDIFLSTKDIHDL